MRTTVGLQQVSSMLFICRAAELRALAAVRPTPGLASTPSAGDRNGRNSHGFADSVGNRAIRVELSDRQRSRNLRPLTRLAIAVLVLCRPAFGASNEGIDFNRDIRPILSDRCYACHGPDEKKRKAGLRLDRREDALKTLKSGNRAIVPGDPEQSTLVQRLRSHDPEEVMPPPKEGKLLLAEQ